MNAKEIINTLLDDLSLKAPSFAKTMGEKYQRIYDIQKGKTKNISGDLANKIVSIYPKYSIEWLLTGEGEMLKSEEKEDSISPVGFEHDYTLKDFFKDYYSYMNYNEVGEILLNRQLSKLTDREKEVIANKMGLDYQDFVNGIEIITQNPSYGKLVPIYDTRAAAGNSHIELTGAKNGWVNIGDILKDSEGAIYIYGNSMIPGYPPGSLIGVRPLNETFIEPGSVYVIQTESNRYVKRLYYNEDKTALICLSDNHIKHTDGPMEGQYLYPPFEIPFSSVKCIYTVTGVIKRNSIMMS